MATPGSTTVQAGTSNGYPPGQCTWYADERYHQLTGYYVPWAADAHGWLAGAVAAGWQSSPYPPSGIPSIVVLQAGVQGADVTFGHVGIVEKINPDGSVYTSDLNWGQTAAARSQVTHVTFRLGPGVNFVWASPDATAQQGSGNSSTWTAAAATALGTLTPDASAAASLAHLDLVLELVSPFDTSMYPSSDITILGQDTGLQNPIDWFADVATNVIQDSTALILRTVFLVIGAIIIIKVAGSFIDYSAIGQTATSGFQSISGLLASNPEVAAAL